MRFSKIVSMGSSVRFSKVHVVSGRYSLSKVRRASVPSKVGKGADDIVVQNGVKGISVFGQGGLSDMFMEM